MGRTGRLGKRTATHSFIRHTSSIIDSELFIQRVLLSRGSELLYYSKRGRNTGRALFRLFVVRLSFEAGNANAAHAILRTRFDDGASADRGSRLLPLQRDYRFPVSHERVRKSAFRPRNLQVRPVRHVLCGGIWPAGRHLAAAAGSHPLLYRLWDQRLPGFGGPAPANITRRLRRAYAPHCDRGVCKAGSIRRGHAAATLCDIRIPSSQQKDEA